MIIRPSFTLGGVGGGIAYNIEEFRELAGRGIDMSPVHEVLLEESVIGWKEFELEVMRDSRRQLRRHLLDRERRPDGRPHRRQHHRRPGADADRQASTSGCAISARRIIRRVGVETGGSNIQFAINPRERPDHRHRDEPARVALVRAGVEGHRLPDREDRRQARARLHLDEIPNDITRLTPASFEPTIDYVVVKVPRWAFEKFPRADRTLTTQMKSVGEVMAIGRTFKEAFMKAFRSLELGASGLLFGQPAPAARRPDRRGRARARCSAS